MSISCVDEGVVQAVSRLRLIWIYLCVNLYTVVVFFVFGVVRMFLFFFFFQAEDGIRDYKVTGVQTCALPICVRVPRSSTELVSVRHRAVWHCSFPIGSPGNATTDVGGRRCCRWLLRAVTRSEEHTSELQSPCNLVCRLLLEKKKTIPQTSHPRLLPRVVVRHLMISPHPLLT